MKMSIAFILAATVVASGCATKSDPGVAYPAYGVHRNEDGTYVVKDGERYPVTQAVQQCLHDGDKRLSILASVGDKEMTGSDDVLKSFRCL